MQKIFSICLLNDMDFIAGKNSFEDFEDAKILLLMLKKLLYHSVY